MGAKIFPVCDACNAFVANTEERAMQLAAATPAFWESISGTFKRLMAESAEVNTALLQHEADLDEFVITRPHTERKVRVPKFRDVRCACARVRVFAVGLAGEGRDK